MNATLIYLNLEHCKGFIIPRHKKKSHGLAISISPLSCPASPLQVFSRSVHTNAGTENLYQQKALWAGEQYSSNHRVASLKCRPWNIFLRPWYNYLYSVNLPGNMLHHEVS
jgi:hypothetical protein